MKPAAPRRLRKLSLILVALLATPLLLHWGVVAAARLTPPDVTVPAGGVQRAPDGLRRFGQAYVKPRGKLLQVGLSGAPEQIGFTHVRLLYDEMVENEGVLLGQFRDNLSFAPFRWLLLDLAQLRFRDVDAGMSEARKREIAGGALAFDPDPYLDVFPTYQRFVYLNALYDMALSFEHSPLIGCTSFVLGPKSTGGKTLLGRAFDMEVDILDQRKAVFFVREDGQIPFASVAWPGLVGVVSGLNLEGVAVVVHGARAGEPQSQGEPVVHGLRRVLSTSRSTDEAVAALKASDPMVSHIVVVADAQGERAVVERIPGRAPYMYRLTEPSVVTNHLLGSGATDPKNQRVRDTTSTLARERRGKQLLERLHGRADVETTVRLLRDRRGLNDAPLPLGSRDAIDALIATHGVVMDTTDRRIWVSEAPHLLGRFVAFDLRRLLAEDYDPAADREAPPFVPEDPLLKSEEYQKLARPDR